MKKESLKQKTAEVCALVERHKRPDGRTILAIAGAPASGKSTLAESVVKALMRVMKVKCPRRHFCRWMATIWITGF